MGDTPRRYSTSAWGITMHIKMGSRRGYSKGARRLGVIPGRGHYHLEGTVLSGGGARGRGREETYK